MGKLKCERQWHGPHKKQFMNYVLFPRINSAIPATFMAMQPKK